jgi:uncharacterized membrane protein YqaE (UPF0057 family)
MKKILFKFFIINILLFVVSCSTSNEFNLNSRIQKRRYSNGYYLSSFKKIKKHKNESYVSNDEKVDEIEIINQNSYNSTYASIEDDLHSISIPLENQKNNNKFDSLSVNNQNFYVSDKQNISIINNNIESRISNQTTKEFKVDKKSFKSYFKLNDKSKNNDDKLLTILFFVLALILPPLSVLLYTNIDWKKVLIATILTCLWWVPGVLYAILVLLEIL